MMGIYAILALSLNFHYGYAGLINFGHVAFFITGAYASALITKSGSPFIIGIIIAGISSGILGFLIALPTSKLSVHYWAICTMAIAEIIRIFINNEEWLTGGSFGLPGIPQPFSSFIPVSYYPFFYLVVLVIPIVAFTYFILNLLINSPFGFVLKAIREGDDLPLAMGKNVYNFRVTTMGIGAFFAGIAGALYAHYICYLNPLDFTPVVTFLVWSMIIVGGKGNNNGAIVGAIVIIAFYNSTRFLKDYLNINADILASFRMVAIGMLIILTLLFKREGLLKEKKYIFKLKGEDNAKG
jgi:ABC-type branched-subunit amino acid transport system permease subunit